MVTIEQLQIHLSRTPFIPLRVTLTRGRTIHVAAAQQTLLTRDNLLVGTDIAADGVAERYALCPLAQLTAIDQA